MAAFIRRSRCCSLCEGHGLQACQGLLRPEGGCRPLHSWLHTSGAAPGPPTCRQAVLKCRRRCTVICEQLTGLT